VASDSVLSKHHQAAVISFVKEVPQPCFGSQNRNITAAVAVKNYI
jgi:hypothetical protein